MKEGTAAGAVCYGGISLAVYMHGVVKEILKLVRASAAYHSVPDVAARQALSHDDLLPEAERARRETDTEAVYFEALKTIGRQLDLRVIVDVVAGASAGGINAIFSPARWPTTCRSAICVRCGWSWPTSPSCWHPKARRGRGASSCSNP